MPAGLQDDVEQILETIIRTSIDKEAAGPADRRRILNEKIAVSVQPFNGKAADIRMTTKSVYSMVGLCDRWGTATRYCNSSVLVIQKPSKSEEEEEE